MLATMYLYGQRVRIVAGRYEAMHPRKFQNLEDWFPEIRDRAGPAPVVGRTLPHHRHAPRVPLAPCAHRA
jgi:hypothetical protein